MARLLYNNEGGRLGADPGASGTTITFAIAPNFATLSGSDYIPLVLDAGLATMEIVYLTAYTAAAATGTITRAAEDPSHWPAVSHSSGSWVCAPTVLDLVVPVCRVYRNSAYTPAVTAYTLLPFDTVSFDTAGAFNTSTHLYTTPSAGYYRVLNQWTCSNTTDGSLYLSVIYKNGVEVQETRFAPGAGSVALGFASTDLISCATGDTLGGYYYSPGSAAFTVGSLYTYMTIDKVANG